MLAAEADAAARGARGAAAAALSEGAADLAADAGLFAPMVALLADALGPEGAAVCAQAALTRVTDALIARGLRSGEVLEAIRAGYDAVQAHLVAGPLDGDLEAQLALRQRLVAVARPVLRQVSDDADAAVARERARQTERLGELAAASAILNRGLDLTRALQEATELARRFLDADWAVAALVRPLAAATTRLHLVAWAGLAGAEADDFDLRTDAGVARDVIAGGGPFVTGDYAAIAALGGGRAETWMGRHGFGSVLFVPLAAADGSVRGLIGAGRRTPGEITADTVQAATLLANQAATAVANVETYQRAWRLGQAARRAVGEVGESIAGGRSPETVLPRLLELAVDVFGAEAASALRLVDERGALRIRARVGLDADWTAEPGRSLAARALTGNGPVGVGDVRTDGELTDEAPAWVTAGLRAAIAAPVRVGGEAWGVLEVYFAAPRTVERDELDALASFAAQAAAVIAAGRARAVEVAHTRRLHGMYELTRSLAGTVRVAQTHRVLAGGMLRAFDAQLALVVVPDVRRDQVTVVASAGTRDDLRRFGDAMRSAPPVRWSGSLLERCARAGVPVVLSRFGDPFPAGSGAGPRRASEGVLPAFRAAAVARFGAEAEEWSAIAFPLAGDGLPLAAMVALRTDPSPRGRFSADDEVAARSLARHAALAVRNAHRYEQQLDVATVLQNSLLPRDTIETCGGLAVGTGYRSSAVDTALVGGDFIDVLDLGDGRGAALIGDVCGKGVQAAVDAARVRYAWRALAARQTDPGALLAEMNELCLRELAPDAFVTVAHVLVEDGGATVRSANAGHPSPLAIARGRGRGAATLREIEGAGPPLGVVEGAVYPEVRTTLAAGETLLMATDGLADARDAAGHAFTDARARAIAREAAAAGADAAGVAAALMAAIAAHAGDALSDDVAVLCLGRPA